MTKFRVPGSGFRVPGSQGSASPVIPAEGLPGEAWAGIHQFRTQNANRRLTIRKCLDLRTSNIEPRTLKQILQEEESPDEQDEKGDREDLEIFVEESLDAGSEEVKECTDQEEPARSAYQGGQHEYR